LWREEAEKTAQPRRFSRLDVEAQHSKISRRARAGRVRGRFCAPIGKDIGIQESAVTGTSRNAIPSFHGRANDSDLKRLLNPTRFYEQPHDVIDDPKLSLEERRAVLSSWASDACAVESMPALRQIPGSPSPTSFDAVMEALQVLDSLARPAGAAYADRPADPATLPAS